MKNFFALAFMLMCVMTCTAFAEETADIPPTENAQSAQQENIVRIGLFYGETALAELKVQTSGVISLPGELNPMNSVSVSYVPETGGMQVKDSNGVVLLEQPSGQPCLMQAGSGSFVIGERSYRRSLEVTATPAGLKVVNILPFDEYICGVLPNEIYPSWPEEALKASAVAARSFTIAGMGGKHSEDGFDLCTTTHCQVYRGMGTEQASTNKAVFDTKNQVLTYGGKVISAMYSANNGGYTEGTENVWSAKLDYYTIKADPYTPVDSWSVPYTAEEIEAMLIAKGKNIGKVKSVIIDKTSPSGRVTGLRIVGSDGEYALSKDGIRSFFKLKSNMFIVETTGTASRSLAEAVIAMENSADIGLAVAALTDTNRTFTFNGQGYGHGVGMSQWGCKYRADAGQTYIEILAFYYDGATVSNYTEIMK